MKEKLFNKELTYIKTPEIKESLIYMINQLPDYFFTVAASSTGKYHPEYALGDGGLLRHTKAAARIAHELLENPQIGDKYTTREKDLMLMAIILHDGIKHGDPMEKYVKFDHPIIIADKIMESVNEMPMSKEDALFVSDAIKTHMGPWTKDYKGNEVLEKPVTKYQNFVHMCDYLASRKCLLVPFNSENEIDA